MTADRLEKREIEGFDPWSAAFVTCALTTQLPVRTDQYFYFHCILLPLII